jgi:uncharacterized protein YcnI
MRIAAIATFVALGAAILDAHVTVRPRESQAGAEERYTVRVPTEGQVTTTSVELEVPPDVTIVDIPRGQTYVFDARRDGDRVVAITWKQDIKPKEVGEFVFLARNPRGTLIIWKARQRFADGTSADWVGVEGDRRPASVTRLIGAP